jgi:hypothetical protein
VLYLRLIIFSVRDDIPVDSEIFLVTDFMNLKIKSAQSFGVTHKVMVCVCVHKGECSYIYEYLRLYCICQKIDNRDNNL